MKFSSSINILSPLYDPTHSKRNDNKDIALEYSNELIIYDFIDVDDRHLSSFFLQKCQHKKNWKAKLTGFFYVVGCTSNNFLHNNLFAVI